MNKNDICEIVIEDMGKDGEGIGHVDGMTVFVKDTVVGDRASVKVMKVKKNLAYARLMEIREPSPYRVTPICEKAVQCGGCTLQHISYEKQLELLQNHVKNCLIRIGGLKDAEALMEPILGMEEPFHFRNKMQFPVGTDRDGAPQLGFYAGRTHSLIPLSDCPVGHPVNRVVLQAVKEYIREANVPVYDEAKHAGLLRHVLTRVGFGTGQVMVCLVVNGDRLPEEDLLVEKLRDAVDGIISDGTPAGGTREESEEKCVKECGPLRLASVCMNINTEKTNRILGFQSRVIFGTAVIEDTIGDIRFEIAPESFFQVNPVQTGKLYGKALEYAGLTGEETVWDMYCGIGTISLFLARKAKKVYGVEIVPQAIRNAKRNAELNGFQNTEFFVGKAEEIVPKLYAEDPDRYRADVVVVDPPRKGCDAELLSTIAAMFPKRLVYVSCDPATLARDISILSKEGFVVEKVATVDMFPHSMHVETVCLLERLRNAKDHVTFTLDMEDYYRIKDAETDKKNDSKN